MGTLIFAATYLLISTRRFAWLGIDRPTGAMLGAIACVAFGVLRPDAALAAIDGRTLLLLFGEMGMGALLTDEKLVRSFEHRVGREHHRRGGRAAPGRHRVLGLPARGGAHCAGNHAGRDRLDFHLRRSVIETPGNPHYQVANLNRA